MKDESQRGERVESWSEGICACLQSEVKREQEKEEEKKEARLEVVVGNFPKKKKNEKKRKADLCNHFALTSNGMLQSWDRLKLWRIRMRVLCFFCSSSFTLGSLGTSIS